MSAGPDAPVDGSPPGPRFEVEALLKRDLFSTVERGTFVAADGSRLPAVRRDWTARPWWTALPAAWLAARERAALRHLDGFPDVPRLLHTERGRLVRSHLPGAALHEARPRDPAYYGAARRLLVRLHRRGLTHNDLAKEPNWMVLPDGRPGLIDFQLARVGRRTAWFRLLAREDLRHLLKHKRTYAAEHLTASERRLLATPSLPARLLRGGMKPVYLFVTRRLLGWRDREGKGPRP